jgi:hypothetical protein
LHKTTKPVQSSVQLQFKRKEIMLPQTVSTALSGPTGTAITKAFVLSGATALLALMAVGVGCIAVKLLKSHQAA